MRPERSATKKTAPALSALAIALLLSACSLTEVPEPCALPRPEARTVLYAQDVSFPEGAESLGTDQELAIARFLDRLGKVPGDRIEVLAGGGDALAQRRAETVAAWIAWWGGEASVSLNAPDVDGLRVQLNRVSVVLNGCPDWTERPGWHFDNQAHANLGCATAMNLGLMVADPRDLARGREPGLASAEAHVLGQQRYRKGETKALTPEAPSAEQGTSQQSSSSSGSN